MTKQYTSKDYFPEWYKSVEVIITENVVENRLTSINELVENEDIDLWLNIVRLALDLKIESQTSITQIVDIFKSSDISFPISKNENIIKVLSKISLCFLFERGTLFSKLVSRGVVNASFFSAEKICEIPYLQYAEQNLSNILINDSFDIVEISQSLEAKQTDLENDEEDEELIVNEDWLHLVKTANYLLKENKSLKDETNVLWWLFGQYSRIYSSYFSEVGSSKMIIAAAKELCELTNHKPIKSAKHILHKVLLLANNQKTLKNINISTVITECEPVLREELLINNNLGDLTPILFALSLSKDLKEDSLWQAAFKNSNSSFDAKKSFAQHEIVYQIYSEIIFLELIKEMDHE